MPEQVKLVITSRTPATVDAVVYFNGVEIQRQVNVARQTLMLQFEIVKMGMDAAGWEYEVEIVEE